MTKARDLANFVSTGNPLADGTLDVADISDLTASAAELNVLDGITASTAELNILDGVTSSTAELNLLDGAVANTVVNSTAVIYGASGEITANQIDILAQGDLRLQDTTGGQYVALQAPGTVSSSFTLTLPAADGTNGQFLKTDGSGTLSFDTVSVPVQYPQESKSADYTLVLADAGKQIFHPASDTAVRTFTIPANGSVAFPVGTVILFTVENNAFPIYVDITTDTLVTNANRTGKVVVNTGNTLYCIKTTSTKWQGYYLQQEDFIATTALAVTYSTAPYITVYTWSSGGFGGKYSDPGSVPNTSLGNPAFSKKGDFIAVSTYESPYVAVYPWSGSGFGLRYTSPATLPTGYGNGVAFSPAGDAIAVAHITSPYVSAYPWSGSGFGTKFSNPGTLPTGTGQEVAFSPAGDAIAVAHNTSPYVSAYPWSGSGFGTKFSNPGTLPTGNGNGVAFSPAGDAIAVAHSAAGASGPYVYITAYPWSGSGFGTKFSNPGTTPTGNALGVAFSPAGDAIAVSYNQSPYITAYPWSSSGFGTAFTTPVGFLPGNGTGNGVSFSPAGDAIAVAHAVSPYVTAAAWSGSGFGTKFSAPSTPPTSTAVGIAFTPV